MENIAILIIKVSGPGSSYIKIIVVFETTLARFFATKFARNNRKLMIHLYLLFIFWGPRLVDLSYIGRDICNIIQVENILIMDSQLGPLEDSET